MALLPVIENKTELEKLPEPVRGEYVEKDGKFFLNVQPVGGFALENVEGLRSALSAERKAKKDAEDRAKLYEGLDPAKAREAMTKVDEMSGWTPGEKVAELVKSREAQVEAKFRPEVEKLSTKLTARERELRRLLVENEGTRVLAGKDGKPLGSAKLLMPTIAQHTKIEETDDGRYVRKVIDDDGNVLVTRRPNQSGDMDLEEYITDVMAKDPDLAPGFFGSQHSGAGSTSPGKAGVTGGPRRVSTAELGGQTSIEDIAAGKVAVDMP